MLSVPHCKNVDGIPLYWINRQSISCSVVIVHMFICKPDDCVGLNHSLVTQFVSGGLCFQQLKHCPSGLSGSLFLEWQTVARDLIGWPERDGLMQPGLNRCPAKRCSYSGLMEVPPWFLPPPSFPPALGSWEQLLQHTVELICSSHVSRCLCWEVLVEGHALEFTANLPHPSLLPECADPPGVWPWDELAGSISVQYLLHFCRP